MGASTANAPSFATIAAHQGPSAKRIGHPSSLGRLFLAPAGRHLGDLETIVESGGWAHEGRAGVLT